MKKTVLLAVCLLFSLSLFSQLEFSKEKFNSHLDATAINASGKKMSGKIWYTHPVPLSNEVEFNAKMYKPGELKEFTVNDIKWISVKDKKDEKFNWT